MGKNKNKGKGKGSQGTPNTSAGDNNTSAQKLPEKEEAKIYEIFDDDDAEESIDTLDCSAEEKKTSNKSNDKNVSDSCNKEVIAEKDTKNDGKTEDKTSQDVPKTISDGEKCRNNWSPGVQATEDFFAGKGHPKKEPKITNSKSKDAVEQNELNAPQKTDTNPSVKSTKINKPKESPKKPNTEATEETSTPRVPQGDCVVCDRSAKAICSGCKHVFYCTRDHQKSNWSTHKEDCKSLAKLPYRIERDNEVGRHLVATVDIPAGQIILNELPIICGPRQMTKPVCLGCHKELTDPKKVVKCSRCHWPLCSRKCEDSPIHDPECRIIRYGGTKVQMEVYGQINMMYACITVLRALALMDGPQKTWMDYTKFESHLEERLKTEVYTKVNKEKVVFFIHHYLKLLKKYSDYEILEACGRLDTNCFEIKQHGQNLRAMFRIACIISHDCRPNTRHTFGPDNSINLYSTVNIAKGNKITASYTQPLWKTASRRSHLKQSKCFWCNCQRCGDPTEFGTGLSTLICNDCGGNSLPVDPLDPDTSWECEKCGDQLDASYVKEENDRLIEDLKSLDPNDPSVLDDFLRQHATVLPESNQLSREVQYRQVTLFKQVDQKLLDHSALLKKSYLCKQLLGLAEKVEPGMTKWRGQLLFEMQSATVVLAQRALEEGKLTGFQAKEIFEESLDHLREAISILQVEPDGKEELQEQMGNLSRLLTNLDDEE